MALEAGVATSAAAAAAASAMLSNLDLLLGNDGPAIPQPPPPTEQPSSSIAVPTKPTLLSTETTANHIENPAAWNNRSGPAPPVGTDATGRVSTTTQAEEAEGSDLRATLEEEKEKDVMFSSERHMPTETALPSSALPAGRREKAGAGVEGKFERVITSLLEDILPGEGSAARSRGAAGAANREFAQGATAPTADGGRGKGLAGGAAGKVRSNPDRHARSVTAAAAAAAAAAASGKAGKLSPPPPPPGFPSSDLSSSRQQGNSGGGGGRNRRHGDDNHNNNNNNTDRGVFLTPVEVLMHSSGTAPVRDASKREGGSREEPTSRPPPNHTPHMPGPREALAVSPRATAGNRDQGTGAIAEGNRRRDAAEHRGQQAQASRGQMESRRAETTTTMTASMTPTTRATGRVVVGGRRSSPGDGNDNNIDKSLSVAGAVPGTECSASAEAAAVLATSGVGDEALQKKWRKMLSMFLPTSSRVSYNTFCFASVLCSGFRATADPLHAFFYIRTASISSRDSTSWQSTSRGT